MSKLPEDLPDCMVFLLGKAYQKAHADFKKRLKPYALTNMQHLVLEALWYQEGVTATDLCKILILDKATLSGVLERMTDADWILKKTDPEDRRVHLLYPSEKANKMKDELIRERKKANDELMSVFSPEERILLRRLLQNML